MVIHSLTYVGKLNEPLFTYVDTSTVALDREAVATTMYLEGIVHASLDIIEERRTRKPQTTAANAPASVPNQEMFLGQVWCMPVSQSLKCFCIL